LLVLAGYNDFIGQFPKGKRIIVLQFCKPNGNIYKFNTRKKELDMLAADRRKRVSSSSYE